MNTRFFVPGIPAPQGSKRHVGNGVMIESSRKVGPWREAVKAAVIEQQVPHIPGPVEILITFWMPRPRSHYGTGRNAGELKASAPPWCPTKPDIDKLVRSTLDALTDCARIEDDSRVVSLTANKAYTPAIGAGPGADITIRKADQ